jgi:Flp pilus assembly protein TadG
MSRQRGQSLLELALCAPILVSITLGTVAAVRLADARAGLDAATAAAAASAARAPSPEGAVAAARRRFAAVIQAYPVESPALELEVGSFGRRDQVRATGRGTADLSFALLPSGSARIALSSTAVAQVEPWRSR